MWIILRLCLAIGALFFRFLLGRNNGGTLIENGGRSYMINYVKDKYGNTVRTEVIFPSKNNFYFRIVKEGALIKFLKACGLVSEMQTGNPEFDEHHYIAVDHPRLQSEISLNDKFRRTMIELKMQWNEISAHGISGVKFQTKGSKPPTEEEILKMSHFVDVLEKIQVPKSDPFYLKVIAFELFMFGVTGYGIGSYFEIMFFDTMSLLDPWDLLLKGVLCGLLVFFIWIAGALFILRKSSRTPLLIAELGFWCLLGLLTAGPQVFVDLNRVLDRSSPTLTKATIEDKYSRTTGGGKRRRTHYYLQLKFDENPYGITRRFPIAGWDYHRFTKNHGIQFSIREGAFKAAYVEEFEPLTLVYNPVGNPSAAESPHKERLSSEQKNEISEALKWKAVIPTTESGSGSELRIVRYGNDQVKSEEPQINGLLNGVAKYWHANGKLYSEIPYVNGEKHGEFKPYREDGSLEQHLSYKSGQPHGLLQWFNEKGQLSSRAVYIQGQHFPLSDLELQQAIERAAREAP